MGKTIGEYAKGFAEQALPEGIIWDGVSYARRTYVISENIVVLIYIPKKKSELEKKVEALDWESCVDND